MSNYTKLWSFIVTSTIWSEPSETRIVWVTMLAITEPGGYVAGSIPGLARLANVSLKECETAIATLLAPDPYSRTKDNEGRRIAEADGGWMILNYLKHREAASVERRRELTAERTRRYRLKKQGKDASGLPLPTRPKPQSPTGESTDNQG